MDKQHILHEIRRTAQENDGVALGRRRFLTETGIRESDWLGRYWLRWSDALREAGLEPNVKQAAFDEDRLMEALAGLVRELGHYPVSAEIRLKAHDVPGFPSHNTFRRLGKKAQVASALVNWCEANAGWEDVQGLCAPVAAQKSAEDITETDSTEPEFGYVYMLKSGKYYKIGRSRAPGRREYELAIQLPEPVASVHTIKTDDPVGIEKYWHQRFSDRRKNGEWFELRQQDVSAFRRRKFM